MTKNVLVALFVMALFVAAYTPVRELASVVGDADAFAERNTPLTRSFDGC